ncbi:hypothetical protein GOODEAATRI_023487 [Goodea atripinnis]|uniref:Uncharacterized protein n=1 Tax=Goodea atripinnis TaxID=208336 RepID=A0ABV0ND22_9TELE
MTSVGTIRLCPACNTGYIMSYDLHVICEGCLGPDHATLALTPQSTYPSCRHDSAPETATDISTPFLRTEDAKADAKSVQAQGLPMSATTPFTVMGALVSALPDIVAKVAEAKGVSVPPPLAQLPTDDLAGKFSPAHLTRRDPVWPCFPAVTAYLSGAAAETLQLKALVSTFTPITRVESPTDQGFPLVPALEPSLSAGFGVRSARRVDDGLCPPPPAIRSRQADRSLPPMCRSGRCSDEQHCLLSLLNLQEGSGDGAASGRCGGILQFCRYHP